MTRDEFLARWYGVPQRLKGDFAKDLDALLASASAAQREADALKAIEYGKSQEGKRGYRGGLDKELNQEIEAEIRGETIAAQRIAAAIRDGAAPEPVEQNGSQLVSTHEVCPDCKNEIDPTTCHCGDPIDHSPYAGHSPVPMGCTCGYANESQYVEPDSPPDGSQDGWRPMAQELADAEEEYRFLYEHHGGGDLRTGRAWDRMRHAGDVLRRRILQRTARKPLECIEGDDKEGTMYCGWCADLTERNGSQGGWRPTHRHYKGGLYRLVNDKVRAEWEEMRMVIYEDEYGHTWVRPWEEWTDIIMDDTPRFALIESPEAKP